jgi:cellulose synthase/poly-beta-1,6-N-acetylglucosamine synthase-like glycosyltransferase
MSLPLISVIMPVYNGAADLEKAMQSILAQSVTDFEVVAINDGSKDDSCRLLNQVSDPRVRVIHQDNMGLAATLNKGISLARGEFIARQDQDDLSHPDRFARQLAYMRQNTDCTLLGTAAEIWVGDVPSDRTHDHPTRHAVLAFDLLFNNPFVHSSVMMKRDAVVAVGGYTTDPARQPPEDYELWSRMARKGRVANLPERLLVYREMPQSMSRSGPNPFLDRLVTISAENLSLASGRQIGDIHVENLAAYTHSALHRLSQTTDMTIMTKIIADAAQSIGSDDPEVRSRADERSRILRYQWMIHQTGSQWARPFLQRVRRLVRRLPNLVR